MAALTATSWSVRNTTGTGTVFEVNNESVNIVGKKKWSNVRLVLLTSGSTPAAGVPLPTFGRVGLVRNLDYYILVSPSVRSSGDLGSSTVTGMWMTISTGGDRVKFYRGQRALATGAGSYIPDAFPTGNVLGSGLTIICAAVGW